MIPAEVLLPPGIIETISKRNRGWTCLFDKIDHGFVGARRVNSHLTRRLAKGAATT
jgi:hypothetical protein